MTYRALATDYDGTIAHDGVVDDTTVDALRRIKAAGWKLLMVSGRELDDLFSVFPHWKLFDALVLENGALLFDPASGKITPVAPAPPEEFVNRLKEKRVPMSVGRSIVATVEPHDHVVLETIKELGIEWHIIFNKGSVMVLPSGVNKATGLAVALEQMKLDPKQVVAVGDAENDLAFLAACGLGVAVANALPSVKEAAGRVMSKPRGAGVTELIDQLLAEQ